MMSPNLPPKLGAVRISAQRSTKSLRPADVAPTHSQGAAGVFDQGAGHEIRPSFQGLKGLYEFAVAVVYEDYTVRIGLPNCLDSCSQIADG